MTEFHGYSRTWDDAKHDAEVVLSVGMLPGRKRPCLYVARTNKFSATIHSLASFTSEEAAKEAQYLLDHFILGKAL